MSDPVLRVTNGDEVPGFPQHPHRGFETVTIVRRGYIDHSDSLGATARFGGGEVQWLTAGAGVVHSEMFPLLDPNGPNTLSKCWVSIDRRCWVSVDRECSLTIDRECGSPAPSMGSRAPSIEVLNTLDRSPQHSRS